MQRDLDVLMSQRRLVITGQEPSGRSVVVEDRQVAGVPLPGLPGATFAPVWGADEPPPLPTDGRVPAQALFFPGPGGFRFGFFTVPPDSVVERLSREGDAMGEGSEPMSDLFAGIDDVRGRERPRMHTTDTVDWDFIVSGEVWMELDDGVEVRLTAGDSVVQNGTNHAWWNRSSEPCVIAVSIIGTTREA